MSAPRSPARQRILEAADALFHEHSIQGVGIDAIISRAGVAKMSLYHHFRSKDELVAEYLRSRDERVTRDLIESACSRTPDPLEQVLAYFQVVAERVGPGYRGCPFLNAIAEIGDREHPAKEVVLAHKARVRAFFEDRLTSSRAPRPDELAQDLLILLNGALATAMVHGTNEPVERAHRLARILTAAS